MPREVIRQATCTECGEHEDTHTVTNTSMYIEEDKFTYETRCACGATGEVTLDGEGIEEVEGVHHESASWNQEDSDDE